MGTLRGHTQRKQVSLRPAFDRSLAGSGDNISGAAIRGGVVNQPEAGQRPAASPDMANIRNTPSRPCGLDGSVKLTFRFLPRLTQTRNLKLMHLPYTDVG